MDPKSQRIDLARRSVFGSTAALGLAAGIGGALTMMPRRAAASGISDWLDVKADYGAVGNGTANDTTALQNAVTAGAGAQKPVFIPPGSYRFTTPLSIPSNTMLIGSDPGMGFGTQLRPDGCAAFNIGGSSSPTFHCYIENLLIWPMGAAPTHIISVDNCYTICVRNVRIHDTPYSANTVAVKLLATYGPSINIIWENLIVRNDGDMGKTAVLADANCGTHRFLAPDLENFQTLFLWRGGQIEMFAPYTERAGVYCVDCDVDPDDVTAYLNTFGGEITPSAASSGACAIRSTTRNFNSFGTNWSNAAGIATYVYGSPAGPVTFHGIRPNIAATGPSRFVGDVNSGWQLRVAFPDWVMRNWKFWNVSVPANGQASTTLTVAGVDVGSGVAYFWARATSSSPLNGLGLTAYVSATDTVTVLAQNNTAAAIALNANIFVECGWL